MVELVYIGGKMKLQVKTEFMGRVAVRGKFLAEIKRTGEMLIIEHNHQLMSIPARKIDELTVGSTELPVKDYFKHEKDYLFYFKWNPDPVIQKEFIL
jgi:hypothetical protein